MKIIYWAPFAMKQDMKYAQYHLEYDQFVHVHSAHLFLEANLMLPHKRVLLLTMLSVLAHHLARNCRHGNSRSEGHHQWEWE